jgi:two-component system chemotaxis response regulator CheY
MKVLIVEDDFTSRLLLQKILQPYGESHIAVNGKEAVQAFRAALGEGRPYDLVCLDIMLPEMGGQETLQAMRRLEEAAGDTAGRGARIIMTTALDDSGNILKAFREQCDAYLVKPIDKSALLAHLRSFGMIP